MTQLTLTYSFHVPALVTTAGERVAYRFLEFFTATIRNPNTRRAYMRAASDFCRLAEEKGPALD